MTMGVGIRCQEGVLLVADSLEPAWPDDPRYPFWIDDLKIRWLAGTDTAMVVSGYVEEGALIANGFWLEHRPLAAGLPTEDPRARVRRAHTRLQEIDADVRERHPGHDRYAEFDDPGPHTLFAIGGPDPQLGKLTRKTEAWARVGDVFTIGAWLLGMYPELAAEMAQPAPDSLDECKALVTKWVHDFMERVFGYQDAAEMVRATGQMPCIGWPLQMLTLTATGSYIQEAIS